MEDEEVDSGNPFFDNIGKWIKALFWFLVGVGFYSYAVMLIWNIVVPKIFHGSVLIYWDALAIYLLSRFLTQSNIIYTPPQQHSCCYFYNETPPEDQEENNEKKED